MIAVDPQSSTGSPVPFLGSQLALARGAFAIARLAEVPLIPVAARWEGRTIAFTAGPRLTGTDETMLACAAAAWLETYVREHPAEFSQRFVDLARR